MSGAASAAHPKASLHHHETRTWARRLGARDYCKEPKGDAQRHERPPFIKSQSGDPSLRRVERYSLHPKSFRAAAQEKPLYHTRFSRYGLSWRKLKALLEKKFPGYTFAERVEEDQFVFNVPQPLSPDDILKIQYMRNPWQLDALLTSVTHTPSFTPTISDVYTNLVDAPAKRKLFINSTISEDCTNPETRSSSLLSALRDRPRKLMIKSSGIETGDLKRIRLR